MTHLWALAHWPVLEIRFLGAADVIVASIENTIFILLFGGKDTSFSPHFQTFLQIFPFPIGQRAREASGEPESCSGALPSLNKH